MSTIDELATDFYGKLERETRTLSRKWRFEIIVLLAQWEQSVDSISKKIGLPITSPSHHLRDIRKVGVVSTQIKDVQSFYRLSDDAAYEIVVSLCKIAERKSDYFKEVVDI